MWLNSFWLYAPVPVPHLRYTPIILATPLCVSPCTTRFCHMFFYYLVQFVCGTVHKWYSDAHKQSVFIMYNAVVYNFGWSSLIVTRRISLSFAEYWKHFVARLNDVHAFGYNSAGSERIWMKFGALRISYLMLALTDFGRNPYRSVSGSASRFFFGFFVR